MPYNKRGDASVYRQFNYGYNLDGSLKSIQYAPAGSYPGRTVTYAYNAAQRPISAVDSSGINFATAAHYYAFGGLGYVVHGSTQSFGGIVQSENYNVRMQPNEIGATVGGQPAVFDLVYDYYACGGNDGNVCQIFNRKDSARSQAFAYDYLNRLVWAWTPNLNTGGNHNWGEGFTYDPWGNLLGKSFMGSDNPPDSTLTNLIVDTHNQVTSWTYDAAGNIIDPKPPSPCQNPPHPTPSGYPNFYDGQNRLLQTLVGCATTSYDYDGDGQRVKKLDADGTGTLYWRGPGGEVLEETDLNGVLKNEYVFFGGKRIARYNPTNGYSYYFSDHLGSTDVITDANGTIKEESDFYPFGGERIVTDLGIDNRYKFTGKERDPETGCDFFGARYYCNPIGRFITPDWADAPTAVPYANFGNPQSLNLYSYAGNNPTTFGDHDGHCWHWIQAVCNVFQEAYHGILTDYGFKTNKQVRAVQEQQRQWLIDRHVKKVDKNGNTTEIDWSKAKGSDVHDTYTAIQRIIAAAAAKPVNLPAWRDVEIDIDHIISGHTPGGSRVAPGSDKDLFPAEWSEEKIERAVRQAYRSSRKISAITSDGRVLLEGVGEGRTIQMYLNIETETIETAWPK